ncbi:MAG: tRNA (cytidine(34)-2'-O)-methyltransferase [Bdellovibrionota bacterium]
MNKEKQVYQLGESLLNKEDKILKKCPELIYEKSGYVDVKIRDDLLMFHPEVVLYCPQIPQNTGSIARLCAAFSTTLHLIEPMPFQITEKAVRRAGLDYWEHVNLFIHKNFAEFKKVRTQRRLIFIETGGNQTPYEFQFEPGDLIVFGAETFGIPEYIMDEEIQKGAHKLTIPMFNRGVRSINLANTVSIVLYLAVAQLHGSKKRE